MLTAEVADGVCVEDDELAVHFNFGCWACPPTPSPTVVFTSSPSNDPSLGNRRCRR